MSLIKYCAEVNVISTVNKDGGSHFILFFKFRTGFVGTLSSAYKRVPAKATNHTPN